VAVAEVKPVPDAVNDENLRCFDIVLGIDLESGYQLVASGVEFGRD
jgi:hypothetical protein